MTVGSVNGVNVAFLSRHGERHQYPPHVVNYRANIWALKRLGVKRIIAIGAMGALQKDFQIGQIVLCDQFVNRTWGRKDTFYDGPVTTHISVSDPYCADMPRREIMQLRIAAMSRRTRSGSAFLRRIKQPDPYLFPVGGIKLPVPKPFVWRQCEQ